MLTIRTTAALAALVALTGPAIAQDWPTRPLTMVVPFAAGASSDILGRILAPRIAEHLGKPVIVENVGGAGGMNGAALAIQDMIAGQTDYQCTVLSPALPQIEGKLVKPLALLWRNRSPSLPTLATAHEQGLAEFDVSTWHAFFMPKGTPAPIVHKLFDATNAALNIPIVQERLKELGADLAAPERRTPEYLQKFVEREIEKWAAPIKAAGLSAE